MSASAFFDLLKQHPEASNRTLSRMAGIGDKTIGKLRQEIGSMSPFLRAPAPPPAAQRTFRTSDGVSDSGRGAEGDAEAVRAPGKLSRDEAVSRTLSSDQAS